MVPVSKSLYLSPSIAEDLGGYFQIITMCGTKETAYKILFFWYKTPEILHRYDPKTPRVCWRCRGDIESHFHIFWDCPLIHPFWMAIQTFIQDLFSVSLPLDPVHFLLGLPIPGLSKCAKKLATFIILAAKRAIPLRWLSPSQPSLSPVLQTLEQICRMERLTAIVHDTLPQFSKIWDLWDHSDLNPGISSLSSADVPLL